MWLKQFYRYCFKQMNLLKGMIYISKLNQKLNNCVLKKGLHLFCYSVLQNLGQMSRI